MSFIDMTGWIMSEHGVPDSKIHVIKRVDNYVSPSGSSCAQWLCQCECGSEPFVVAGVSLRTGNTKSCGCINFEDLTDYTFDRLRVIKRVANNKYKCAMWECACSCGNEYHPIVSTSDLKSGKVRSCGCLQKEVASLTHKKYNTYDLTNDYGIGWTTNTNQEFYFDLDDYEVIKNYCWLENDQGYIVTKTEKGNFSLRMHRLVLGLKKEDPIVDHKNRKKYDNRKQNLRYSNKQTNGINRGANKNNQLGIKGVFKLKNGHYQAKIQYFNKIYTKSSSSLDEVVEWRINKEKELYGEFAYNDKE